MTMGGEPGGGGPAHTFAVRVLPFNLISLKISFTMSATFTITIESVSGCTARCRVEVCHPDQWDVPSTKNIALQTVVDVFHNFKEGLLGIFGPERPLILKREAAILIRVHPRQHELDYWLGLDHGRKVVIDEAEYRHLEEHGSDDENVCHWGRSSVYYERDPENPGRYIESGGVFYKEYREDYVQFCAEAENAVVEVHLEDEVGNPKCQDGDEFPKATLVFSMRDPSFLFHFVEGYRFDSAMIDLSRGY